MKKDLLSIDDLTSDEIYLVLDTSEAMREIGQRPIKKVPTLRGKTIVNLFYEPSTRTRTSFEIAEKRLSADTLNIAVATSSVLKGETLIDTARNIEAMGVDIIVIRHAAAGSADLLARTVQCSIVNAGDGAHEHPTQALLDALTIRERKGRIAGLKVAIIGDVLHSRVARSNIHLLTKLGASVRVAGPGTLVPKDFEHLILSETKNPQSAIRNPQLQVMPKIEDAIEGADVVMILRIQRERQDSAYFPTLREYAIHYGLTNERLELAKKDAIVLHPGPMNRGIEISSDVADSSRSLILDQVKYGVAVRMAVLYLATGGSMAHS